MAQSQKQENLLSLAIMSDSLERQKSGIMNVGISEEGNRWEIIVKYHGNLEFIANEEINVEILPAGYAIITLPAEFIEALSELPEIEYMELPKSLIYDIYEARETSCITPFINGAEALTGKDVIVAIIDSGIDYFLEDFRNEAGTRILALWDQSGVFDRGQNKLPPEGFSQGVEYSREDINRALAAGREEGLRIVSQTDERGHGTAVASVAASSNSNPLLRGVAPESDLLVVKMNPSPQSDYPSTTELMRALTYCVRKSLFLNRPMVINLSFGNAYGPRDGSALVEQFINEIAGMGKISICVGCGNEGVSGGHISGTVEETKFVEMAIAPRETTVNVQLWKFYEDSFSVLLSAPDGQEFMINPGIIPRRETIVWKTTKILAYLGTATPYSTKQEIFFVFLPEEEYLDSGIWTFRWQSEKIINGRFQMYLPSQVQRNTGTRFYRGNPWLTITNPATAYGVISVAAYNDLTEGYADFSGRGEPFQEGNVFWEERNKPDLAAPGVSIMTTTAGGGAGSFTGTSFSTPIVAGSAALLMEWGIVRGNDPYLYGEKMKAYLRKGAKPIRGEEIYPNNRVGWGALCVRDSIPI